MRFVRKVLGQILRPFYKAFFERPLWWFLARVKAFLLAEIGPQMQANGERLRVIEDRLSSTEGNNAAQWQALEQLLLALFRQPQERFDSAEPEDRAHEHNNIR